MTRRMLILPEGSRNAAWKRIQKRHELEETWRDSKECEEARIKYSGEFVAVRDKKVIEHFAEMELLFKALEGREEKGEDLMEILTDHFILPGGTERDQIIAQLADVDKMSSRDPTSNLLTELYRRAYSSVTQEELDRPFTI
jgi:hypothetical protein